MKKLVEGLQNFREQGFVEERELFQQLAKGQNPNVLFITCSDSRVSPNIMTRTKPGDLFVIRNAGNIIPPIDAPIGGEIATLEYAVKALKVEDIIVCGHSSCGAITGLLHPEKAAGLDSVLEWLKYSKDVFQYMNKDLTDPQERLQNAIRVNVLLQLRHIAQQSYISKALAEDSIKLHGWVYDIGEGQVEAYCSSKNQWVDLIDEGIEKAAIQGPFEALKTNECAVQHQAQQNLAQGV
jgi:carbonic anhydrase